MSRSEMVRDARTMLVTYGLIAANLVVYAVQIQFPRIVELYSTLGRGYLHGGDLYVYDGRVHPGFDTVGVMSGEWYRLLTGAFLHTPPTQSSGIAHIAFNMLWLWMFGRTLEPMVGGVKFLLLYLGSALGGGLAVCWLDPDVSTIGASGAVYGLAAAYFVLSRHNPAERAAATGLAVYFLVWLVISAFFSSWQGHLGGFIAGATIGFAYSVFRRRQTPNSPLPPSWHPERM